MGDDGLICRLRSPFPSNFGELVRLHDEVVAAGETLASTPLSQRTRLQGVWRGLARKLEPVLKKDELAGVFDDPEVVEEYRDYSLVRLATACGSES